MAFAGFIIYVVSGVITYSCAAVIMRGIAGAVG
jgi:hypothetical protein